MRLARCWYQCDYRDPRVGRREAQCEAVTVDAPTHDESWSWAVRMGWRRLGRRHFCPEHAAEEIR